MRPELVTPKRAVLAALLVAPADAKQTSCREARFVSRAHIVTAIDASLGASPLGAFDCVTLSNGRITIDSGCGSTRARLRTRRNGTTRLRARWTRGGELRRVRLRAEIEPDDAPCGRLLAVWNVGTNMPPGCTACADDLHALAPFYDTVFAGQRAALLSHTQDSVIGYLFEQSGSGVRNGLSALATLMAPYDLWRHFFVPGGGHVLLFDPDIAQSGITLIQMVTDDPAWSSVAPP